MVCRGDNKGADQPVYSGSLISAFVICLLENIISKFATSKFSSQSVAAESGLSFTLWETLKIGFVASSPILSLCFFSILNIWASSIKTLSLGFPTK